MDADPLLDRIEALLEPHGRVRRTAMIGGGIGFMLDDRLVCGLGKQGLVVRVGAEAKADALKHAHVRPLQLGPRQAAAFVRVATKDGSQIEEWVLRALEARG